VLNLDPHDLLAIVLRTGTDFVFLLVVYDSRVIEAHRQREGVTNDELLMALRAHEFASPDDVKLAVLEVDGTMSVVSRDAPIQHGRRRVRGRTPRR
jgi:uncharacterized membrane protein YcaP (DUF421 family)